jgi:hypothetical protein
MQNPKNRRISIRVTDQEHHELAAKATAAGMSVSELVRDHIGRVRIFNHADKELWFRKLSSISNTIGALARAASSLSPTDATVTIAYLSAIHRDLDHFIKQPLNYAGEVFQTRDRDE